MKIRHIVVLIATVLLALSIGSVENSRAELVFEECHPDPDGAEHECNVRRLQCRNNLFDWCDQQKDESADECRKRSLPGCDEAHTECMRKIKRCSAGKKCNAHHQCVDE